MMQRIKVLHIITHLGVGGGLDNTLLTVKGLPREKFEVHLAAGELESEERYSDWTARAEEYSDALHAFPDLCRPVDFRRDLAALKQMTKFIKDQNYQIVHTHYAKAGLLGRIAAKRAGVPIIVHTYHTFSWKVAHVFHSSGWRNMMSSVKEQFYVVLERYAASLCKALITVCELNKKEAVERRIAPADKIKTIYSGIDFDRFQPPDIDKNKLCEKFGLDPRAPIIGTVGRLSVQKSPLDFVKAARMVLERHPEAQFLIVGDGPLELQTRTEIESEPRIKLTGFYENIPEILAFIDIFALSSLWEGLGRALTEAMTMGLPVAVTAAGGVPELVIQGETGLLSTPGNPRELADHIIRLLDHPGEAESMGKRARLRVLSDFSVETMVERITGLYQDLLGGNGSYAVQNMTGRQAKEENLSA
jgi:glycosyltransferase involved in cell wall biosynthesis